METPRRIRIHLLSLTIICGCATSAVGLGADSPDSLALQTEIEQLRSQLPTQAHAMVDVEYHMTNLWFAAHERNWPLAAFYLNETRGRIAWALRLRPVRKLASGQDLDLKPFADALEGAGFAPMRTDIEAKDLKALESSYRNTLEQCYSCHVAAEKPFLRLHVPEHSASDLMHMKP
jgi:hypothetical protein